MKDKIENLNLSVSDLTYDNLDENLIQEIEEDLAENFFNHSDIQKN